MSNGISNSSQLVLFLVVTAIDSSVYLKSNMSAEELLKLFSFCTLCLIMEMEGIKQGKVMFS